MTKISSLCEHERTVNASSCACVAATLLRLGRGKNVNKVAQRRIQCPALNIGLLCFAEVCWMILGFYIVNLISGDNTYSICLQEVANLKLVQNQKFKQNTATG